MQESKKPPLKVKRVRNRKALDPISVDTSLVPTLDDVPFEAPSITEEQFSHILQSIAHVSPQNPVRAFRFEAALEATFLEEKKLRELIAHIAAFYKHVHGKGLRVHEEIARNLGINIAVVVALESACREKYGSLAPDVPAVAHLVLFLFTTEKTDLELCLFPPLPQTVTEQSAKPLNLDRCLEESVSAEIYMGLRRDYRLLAKWIGVISVLLTTFGGDGRTWEESMMHLDDDSDIAFTAPTMVPSGVDIDITGCLHRQIIFASRSQMEAAFTSKTLQTTPLIFNPLIPLRSKESAFSKTQSMKSPRKGTAVEVEAPCTSSPRSAKDRKKSASDRGAAVPESASQTKKCEKTESLQSRTAHIYVKLLKRSQPLESFYPQEKEHMVSPFSLFQITHVSHSHKVTNVTKSELAKAQHTGSATPPYIVRMAQRLWPHQEERLIGMTQFLDSARADVLRASEASAKLCRTLKGMWTQPYHCPRHKVQRLTAYCNHEKVFVCEACIRESHGPHKEKIQTIAMFCALEMSRIQPKFHTVRQRLDALTKVQEYMGPRREEMHRNIDRGIDTIIAALNSRRTTLHADVEQRAAEQLQDLNQSKKDCMRDKLRLDCAMQTLNSIAKRDVSLAPSEEAGNFARGTIHYAKFIELTTFKIHSPKQILDRLSVKLASEEIRKKVRALDWNPFSKHFPAKLYPTPVGVNAGDHARKKCDPSHGQ